MLKSESKFWSLIWCLGLSPSSEATVCAGTAGLWAPGGSGVSSSSLALGVSAVQMPTSASGTTWILGIWTLVLTLAKVLYQPSNLPQLMTYFPNISEDSHAPCEWQASVPHWLVQGWGTRTMRCSLLRVLVKSERILSNIFPVSAAAALSLLQ